MTPTLEELRPEIMRAIDLPPKEVFLGFGDDYPECLCMVVLRDVGPARMTKVVRHIRNRVNAGQELRICANIVEGKHKAMFNGLDFEAAWKLSWDVNCATVRWEKDDES
jgi:hypothetical protein